MNKLKQLAVTLLLACLITGSIFVTNADAAAAKVKGLKFVKWNNSSFTSCTIKWNAFKGADGYQVWCGLTNGNNSVKGTVTSTSVKMTGLEYDQVNLIKVRALKVNSKGNVVAGSAWSNFLPIVPNPVSWTFKASGKSHPIANLTWNKIKGSNGGYRVYLSKNPAKKWYLAYTTSKKASATSARITRFNGKMMKTSTNYYFRVVTRQKVNGKYVESKLPSSKFNLGYFYFYRK